MAYFGSPFHHWVVNEAIGQKMQIDIYDEVIRSLANGKWYTYDNAVERKQLIDDPNDVGPDAEIFCRTDWLPWIKQTTHLPTESWVQDPTGYGGSIHVMKSGDYLGCHLDRAVLPNSRPLLDLKLAVVFFLVPEWKPEWGGALQFWKDDARTVEVEIYPAPGRAVVWLSSDLSYHSVSKVACPLGMIRATANVFYYSPHHRNNTRKRALFVPPR